MIPRRLILGLVLVLAAGGVAFGLLLGRPGGPSLPPADESATTEAIRFATAQAEREQTRVAALATSTALAQATATGEARLSATALAYARKTATAQARETAQAPATHTALAVEFEVERAQAEATVHALDKAARQVYGPVSGALSGHSGATVPCDGPDTMLGDFIAEARLVNPYPLSLHTWDYGIVFTNQGEDSDYRLSVNSGGRWFFQLHAPDFEITNRDDTSALDLSDAGANTLKLYVTNDTAIFFANGHYVSTSDMSAFRPNDITASRHQVSVCSGLDGNDLLPGKSILYTGFTIWSLP